MEMIQGIFLASEIAERNFVALGLYMSFDNLMMKKKFSAAVDSGNQRKSGWDIYKSGNIVFIY